MVQSKKGYTGIYPGGCEKEMKKEPSLKELGSMDSGKWYDIRTTNGTSGSMITARKKGISGHRFFLAWNKEHLKEIVHYRE
jgi:hypothetical protein